MDFRYGVRLSLLHGCFDGFYHLSDMDKKHHRFYYEQRMLTVVVALGSARHNAIGAYNMK